MTAAPRHGCRGAVASLRTLREHSFVADFPLAADCLLPPETRRPSSKDPCLNAHFRTSDAVQGGDSLELGIQEAAHPSLDSSPVPPFALHLQVKREQVGGMSESEGMC